MKKYLIITFGCQMNKSDSERIRTIMENNEYQEVFLIKQADFIIINSCSIRQTAIDRVYGRINQTRKHYPQKKIIITGCLLKNDIKKIRDKVDLIFNISNLSDLPRFLNNRLSKKNSTKSYFKIKPKFSTLPIAEIPIMTGCNNFCSYCVVPFVRGREISRPVEEIINEVKNALESGAKEIWLLGQNVNSYDYLRDDKIVKFPDLLRIVNEIPGDFWIRFTSSHPKDFSDDLIQAMTESKKYKPYLNLPIQSGDNSILKKMNRPYSISQYKKIIKKVRKQIPGVAISTDIIVGFPGETKKEFENSQKLFKEIEFDMAYILKYSPRYGTTSFKFKDLVSKEEKIRRAKVLEKILIKTALKKNKKFLGRQIKVLIYRQDEDCLMGKSEHYKTLKVFLKEKTKENFVGKFVDTKITKVSSWGLGGELISNKLVVILGPTASGKTNMSIKLAGDFNGEIISADSRQIYKEMIIGTATPYNKAQSAPATYFLTRGGIPPWREKRKAKNNSAKHKIKKLKEGIFVDRIPHYLLHTIDLRQDFNVAIYKKMAIEKIKEVQGENKTPFLVGGTGLYISAIVDNLEFPKIVPNKKLRQELEKKTPTQLFQIYKKLDPGGARVIQKDNKRRLVRSIEVSMLGDRVFSELKKRGRPIFNVLEIGIEVDREKLKKAIYKRVDEMFEKGLEKEVRKLVKKYSWKNVNLQTIGYQEWKDYFDGKISKDELRQIIKNHTWQYAKRQMTWFKRDNRIQWVKNYSQAKRPIKNFLIK